jgi:hypothetical protein
MLCLLSSLWQKPSPYDIPPGKFSLGELPSELVLEVSALLTPIDKLCFALTCRSLMALLDGKSLAKSAQFQHLKLWPSHPHACFHRDRWYLLGRLEDSYWRRFSGCLKLHPFTEFTEADLAAEAEARLCIFGSLASLVHLCPCITMTYRDKLRLIARLEQDDPTNSRRWHKCVQPYGSTAMVHIEYTAVLENNGHLVIQSQYEVVPITAERPWHLGFPQMGVALVCPHRDITSHCADLVEVAKYNESWMTGIIHPGHPTSITCQWCETTFTEASICSCPPSSPREHSCSIHVSFIARRPLEHGRGGNHSSSDRKWYEQTDLAVRRACYAERESRIPGRLLFSLKPDWFDFCPQASWI